VLILTTLLIVGMFFYQTTLQSYHLKQKKIASVTYTMIRLQRFIEEALVHDDTYLIEQEISSLGIESEIAALALINPQKTIDYATFYEWKNKSAFQTIRYLNHHVFPLSATSKPVIELSKNPAMITAYFPVRYPLFNHNIRSFSYGALYIRYDLSPLISAIYYEVLMESSLFWLGCIILMLALMGILRCFVNKPIKHLITVMEKFATDNSVKAQLTGHGELAILGNAFNRLIEKITQMQTHLVKQKNLYNLLSATNQLIIRTQSQQQLFDEICQIAVKKPNLILAWIGLSNQQTQQVDIVAKAGSASDYLHSLFISLNPNIAQGQGPTAISIRENRCIITNHFHLSHLTEPWHQAAKKAHIQASAAFPICKFNQPIGTFTIYSDQADYFHEEVIALLHEMTGDICFALEKIELDYLKRQAEERFLDVIEASGAYIWELDMQLRYCYLSERVEFIKGYTVKQLLGKQPFDFMVESDINAAINIIEKAIQKKTHFTLICQNISAIGEVLWEEIKGQVVLNEQGEVVKLRGAGMSINQHKQAEAQIIHLEYYDALTCLPNRRLISDHLADKFMAAKQEGKFGALLFLDLDHFKHINDSLGHEIGDELLIQVANRLKGQIHQENRVARLGGDEFVILLGDLSSSLEIAIEMVRQITEKILLSLREPYLLKEHHYHGNGSIGITLFPLPEQNVAIILKQADTALYRAKDSGRNTFQFYRAEMQETADKRLEMEKNLRFAITEQQLQLYYQPQVNHLNQVIGAEILLRWITPDLGFISPDQFIPVAEEAGLIVEMGYWIFQQSFQQIIQWTETGVLTSDQHISINVSSKQFGESDFFNRVSQLVAETQINPATIILELTESVFLDHVDETIEKMLQLRGLGFKFSIDDFGTGYSSLAYLKKLPVNELILRTVLKRHNPEVTKLLIR
jgi:diguanylate cyclase (GGDEF)-like protein/PAS domain S-box-containing protein